MFEYTGRLSICHSKKILLSQEYTKALQKILLNEIAEAPARGYTDYCKLANAIQDDQFKKKIEGILKSTDNPMHKEKAKITLNMMDSQKATTRLTNISE